MKHGIRKAMKWMAVHLYYAFLRLLPLRERKIVFNSNLGKSYSGNPKYIYEHLCERGYDKTYRCVWFYESVKYEIPGRVKQVRYAGLRYLYHMATAKIWFFDCRQPEFIRKRKGVTYVQTWHGTPLKKLALDLDDVFMVNEDSLEVYKEKFKKNVDTWDYLISQNHYSSQIFRRAFGFTGRMLEIGYPRNDVLFRNNNQDFIRRSKKEMGLPLDKKIILYAPTWRDNEYYGQGRYRFNPNLSFERLKEELGQDYAIILKYHYLVMEEIDWTPYQGFIHTFDKSYDIASLYLVSDLLVTDYSSVMFDYSLLKRPIVFYMYDYGTYRDELRGFYFDFEKEAPGPIAKDTDELVRCVKEYDPSEYQEPYEKFMEKFNHWDDGGASERILTMLTNL